MNLTTNAQEKEAAMKTQPIDITVVNNDNLSSLREKTGFLRRLDVKLATSKAAGKALKTIEEEKVKAEANIALTSLKLAESAIRASMVGNAMPQIGALTTRVNAATTAVDQALTNASAAETFTHLSNRASNLNLARELHQNGKITEEEANVVISFAHADAAEDIQRSRKRMGDAKEAVQSLHEFALKGIAEAKNRLT